MRTQVVKKLWIFFFIFAGGERGIKIKYGQRVISLCEIDLKANFCDE